MVTTKRVWLLRHSAWISFRRRNRDSSWPVFRAGSDEMQALREQVLVAPRYVSQPPSSLPLRSSPTRTPRANVSQSRVLSALAVMSVGASTASSTAATVEPRPYVHRPLSNPSTTALTGGVCFLGHIRFSFLIMPGGSSPPASVLLFLPRQGVPRL